MNFYRFARGVVKLSFLPFFRIKVIGRENIPKTGSVLLCPNHISEMDPPVVAVACPREVHFMAKEELFKIPILAPILRKGHAFPVNRNAVDRETLRQGLKVLRDGHTLGLFPEGTRYTNGELGEGLAGAGYFALKTDATVIPCGIIGPYGFWKKVKIIYGQPIDMETFKSQKAKAEEVVKEIMLNIKKIIDDHR